MSVASFFYVHFCCRYLLFQESSIFQNEIRYMKCGGTSHTTRKSAKKWSGSMRIWDRRERWKRKKLKRQIFCNMIGLYMCGIVYFAYSTFMQKIPDHVYLEEGSRLDEQFSFPFSIDQVSEVDGQEEAVSCCRLFGVFPAKEVTVSVVPETKLYVSGKIIGIYGQTNGVLVLGTSLVEAVNGLSYTPAENKINAGDYIISVNQKKVEKKEELIKYLNQYGSDPVELGIVRDGEYIDVGVTPVPADDDRYMIGVWVKDDMAGIGTMTYYSQDKAFGALGHGVGDGENGALLSLSGGNIYGTQLTGIQKGEKGKPGELEGLIYYSNDNKLGAVDSNSDFGIFGQLEEEEFTKDEQEDSLYEVGYKQDMKEGPAQIISNLSGEKTSYSIKITSVDYTASETNRGITFQVTDESLLEQTGGIVQGMSGSPIIQNGKFIGAVTHVFVNDPTKGYGIFAETMLEEK